jgi:hypothetical protein
MIPQLPHEGNNLPFNLSIRKHSLLFNTISLDLYKRRVIIQRLNFGDYDRNKR